MAVWGHRIFDGASAGEKTWVLERVVDRAGVDSDDAAGAGAVSCLAPCGHNLVACTADGGMHLYA